MECSRGYSDAHVTEGSQLHVGAVGWRCLDVARTPCEQMALRKREIGRVGCSTASRRPGGLYMTCMAQATRNPCCNLDENNLQTPSFGYWTQVYSPNPKPSPGSLQYVRVPHLSLSSNAPTSTSSSWLITPILCGLR